MPPLIDTLQHTESKNTGSKHTGSKHTGSRLREIGRTPTLHLRHLSESCDADLLAKAEFLNPGGSIKDRVAWAMVQAAEKSGELLPGGTLVEATAGNTGIGLAWVAATRGFRFVAVMSEADRGPKVDAIRRHGAEVVLVSADTPWADQGGALDVARRLADERGGVFLNQFANPANPKVHEHTTAVEIKKALGQRLDALVVGVGSGGTATGLARALKPSMPDLRVIAATGMGSYLTPHTPSGHGPNHGRRDRIAGITPDFPPAIFERGLVDRIESVSSSDATSAARCLAEVEGIPAGPSSGACLLAAMDEARRRPGSRILIIIGDSASNYPNLQ